MDQLLTDILASTDITRLTTGSRTTLFTEPKPKRRLITEFSTPAHQARQLLMVWKYKTSSKDNIVAAARLFLLNNSIVITYISVCQKHFKAQHPV
jgi:hypothetical protein